jgi:aspartate aminotransferase-like enzyme
MTRSFTPGAVDVVPEVLAAMAKPSISQPGRDFEELLLLVRGKMARLFSTSYPLFIFPGSAATAQETGVRSLIHHNVLCCINGLDSQRWYDIALANGKKVERLEASDGEPVLPQALAEALQTNHFDAVTLVHIESSTGVTNPIHELSVVTQAVSPDTLILVDGSLSIGGVQVEMDSWGIDFLLTGTQFCLALPSGLALAAASDRALKKAETVIQRGWCTDLLLWEKQHTMGSSLLPLPLPLIYALDAQLNRILEEGMENRFARHSALAERLQVWAEAQRLPPLAMAPFRSKTISVLQNTRGLVVDEVNRYLGERGLSLGNAQGRLKDRHFCIAHLGELQMGDIDFLLESLEAYMA